MVSFILKKQIIKKWIRNHPEWYIACMVSFQAKSSLSEWVSIFCIFLVKWYKLIPNKIDVGLEVTQCRQQDNSWETFFLNLLVLFSTVYSWQCNYWSCFLQYTLDSVISMCISINLKVRETQLSIYNTIILIHSSSTFLKEVQVLIDYILCTALARDQF